jgi:hypothetical protein
MLKLRKEQMDSLRDEAFRDPRERILRTLRLEIPEHVGQLSEYQFAGLFADFVERARKYGIQSEHNLYIFIAAALMLDIDFDTKEQAQWVSEHLANDYTSENAKGMLLRERIMELTGKLVQI